MFNNLVHRTKRKRPFLLLEVVLSLSLLVMLFGTLAFLQKDLFFSKKRQQAVYQSFVSEQRAYTVLRSVFHSAKNVECFTPEYLPKLCSCMFDRGVYQDPELSGLVRGELYFSQEHQTLELVVYNSHMLEKSEKIFILDHVKDVRVIAKSLDRLEVHIVREVPAISSHSLIYSFRLVV